MWLGKVFKLSSGKMRRLKKMSFLGVHPEGLNGLEPRLKLRNLALIYRSKSCHSGYWDQVLFHKKNVLNSVSKKVTLKNA